MEIFKKDYYKVGLRNSGFFWAQRENIKLRIFIIRKDKRGDD